MASGTIEFNTNNIYVVGKLDYFESSKNDEKNVSDFTGIIYLRRTNTYYGLTGSTNCNVYLTIDDTEFKIVDNGYIEIPSDNSWVEVGRATKTIVHDSDGSKKISVSTKASVPYSSFGYGLQKFDGFSLDKLNRKSIITTFENFNIEKEFKVNVTKYSANFMDTLQIYCNGTLIKTLSDYITSTIKFTESELNKIFSIMSTVNTTEFKAVITTRSDSTILGSNEKTAEGTIYNSNPNFTENQVTYKDTNTKTIEVTGDNSCIVQNKSNLVISLQAATPIKGASITQYKITVNGVVKTSINNGDFNFGIVNSAVDITAKIVIIDSRNNSTTVYKKIKMIEYFNPKIGVAISRLNNYEDTTYLTVKVDVADILNKNSIQNISVSYRKITTEEGAYVGQNLENNKQIVLNCSKEYGWEFYFTVIDKIGTYYYYGYTIGKGVMPFFVDVEKLSTGINCFPKHEKSLEIIGNMYINEECKIYYDTSNAQLCAEILGNKFVLAEVKGNG